MIQLLDHILETEGIFKPIAKEEIPIRHRQYLKSVFDKLEKEGRITKNEDGTVDIKGDLDLGYMGLASLLNLPYKIRKITGSFSCSYNRLTSLEGAPEQVGGCFGCHGNRLTSLEGAPEFVGGSFWCGGNKLTSLKGAPKEVGGNFYYGYNKLLKDVEVSSKVKGGIIR